MKLVNNRYQRHLDFDKYSSHFLIIENAKEYLKVVKEMYDEYVHGIESEFVLSDNGKIIDIAKNCLFLHEYFDLDINNKKIISEINSRVSHIFSNLDLAEDFYALNQIFININDKIVDNFDFKLDYDSEMSPDKLIKMANFRVSDQASFAEKLMNYIKIYSNLKKTKLVIFVGISQFLTQDELETFIKQLEYLELKCLLIEPYEKYTTKSAGKIIIDNDLCEI